MTEGGMCRDTSCAWPSYIKEWFARARPNWKVNVTNLAQSGHGAFEWGYTPIPFLSRRPDVIIVDTSVRNGAH